MLDVDDVGEILTCDSDGCFGYVIFLIAICFWVLAFDTYFSESLADYSGCSSLNYSGSV